MFHEKPDHFHFEWKHLGDINEGRPNMGPSTSVAIYRLMQYTLRDAAASITDKETADRMFYQAGFLSGKAIYENMMEPPTDANHFVSMLQQLFSDLKIGILRFEEIDLTNMNFTLTVHEDLDCSGLPIMGEAVCTYDEGVIAGLLEAYSGFKFHVKEVDCWCTGERVCRFQAKCTSEKTNKEN